MNLEEERKAFLYELDGHGYTFTNMKWLGGCFEDSSLQMAWEMWQASVNREGFVLIEESDRDCEVCGLIDQRDHFENQAEQLKDKLQDLYDVDFGEHSNCNCPFQNAIDFDDSALVLVPKEPTGIMINAALNVLTDYDVDCEIVYKAMIEAWEQKG